MSTVRSNSLFVKPQRKNRPVPKKTTKHSTERDSRVVNNNKNNSKHSLVLSRIDSNSQLRKQREEEAELAMITRNRITTQAGIFNMAKISKTVSRGPLTSNNDAMMDQEDSSMISRVINQNCLQSLDMSIQTQEHSQMDISKSATPECDSLKHPTRRQSALGLTNSQNRASNQEQEIPFKEIEHNLLHAINPEDYLKRSNTLSLIKRDLHATIKRNIPHEIYLQFFKRSEHPQQPVPPSLPDKRAMPLQPSRLANMPLPQDRKLSEWTMLMGTFSSQEDEDNSQLLKVDSKSNVTSMMETDLPLASHSQQSMGVYDSGLSKPDYLDSPTPVTMYPHKMF